MLIHALSRRPRRHPYCAQPSRPAEAPAPAEACTDLGADGAQSQGATAEVLKIYTILLLVVFASLAILHFALALTAP